MIKISNIKLHILMITITTFFLIKSISMDFLIRTINNYYLFSIVTIAITALIVTIPIYTYIKVFNKKETVTKLSEKIKKIDNKTIIFFILASLSTYVYVFKYGIETKNVFNVELVSNFLFLVFFPAVVEELLLRGILYVEYRGKKIFYVLVSATYFSIMHMQFDYVSILYYFFIGILFGTYMLKSENVAAVILVHITLNYLVLMNNNLIGIMSGALLILVAVVIYNIVITKLQVKNLSKI